MFPFNERYLGYGLVTGILIIIESSNKRIIFEIIYKH